MRLLGCSGWLLGAYILDNATIVHFWSLDVSFVLSSAGKIVIHIVKKVIAQF